MRTFCTNLLGVSSCVCHCPWSKASRCFYPSSKKFVLSKCIEYWFCLLDSTLFLHLKIPPRTRICSRCVHANQMHALNRRSFWEEDFSNRYLQNHKWTNFDYRTITLRSNTISSSHRIHTAPTFESAAIIVETMQPKPYSIHFSQQGHFGTDDKLIIVQEILNGLCARALCERQRSVEYQERLIRIY